MFLYFYRLLTPDSRQARRQRKPPNQPDVVPLPPSEGIYQQPKEPRRVENLQIAGSLSKNDGGRSCTRTEDPTASDGAPVPNFDNLFVGTRKDYSNSNPNNFTNISNVNCNGGTSSGNIYTNFVQRGSNNNRGTKLGLLPSWKMHNGNVIVDSSGPSSFLYKNEVVMKGRACSSRNRCAVNRKDDRSNLIQHRMKTFYNTADCICTKPPTGLKKNKVQEETHLMNPTLVCIFSFFFLIHLNSNFNTLKFKIIISKLLNVQN